MLAEPCKQRLYGNFFRHPARDGGDHFARSEAHRLRHEPVVQRREMATVRPCHQGAIAVAGDLLGRHGTDLLEQARILRSGALGEAGVRRAGTEASHGDARTRSSLAIASENESTYALVA